MEFLLIQSCEKKFYRSFTKEKKYPKGFVLENTKKNVYTRHYIHKSIFYLQMEKFLNINRNSMLF